MNKILLFLFGYKEYTFDKKDIKRLANIFLTEGYGAYFDGNKIRVRSTKTKKFEELIGTRVKFFSSEIRGFGGFARRLLSHFGICAALLICAALMIISSDYVYDIRVSGSEGGYEEKIIEELNRAGFFSGCRWSKTDKSTVEVDVLQNSEYISWININRRGNVAYVSVIDKETHTQEEEKKGYSNVVASVDGVIDEITVISGVAKVKAGDSVKKGDILISGVLPAESGGGFCFAEGRVSARVSDSVEVKISDTREEKVAGEKKLNEITLKFFNFNIKIFKYYGKSDKMYDIIYSKEDFSFKDGKKLPFSLIKTYSVPYDIVENRLSESEMVELASAEMSEMLGQRLSDATLLRIKTDGGFENSYYIMRSEIVVSEEIGTNLPFEVN